MLPAVVVKSACQYIAMVALTKSGLDRLVHITWEVREIEEQKVLVVEASQLVLIVVGKRRSCVSRLLPLGRNSLMLVVWLLTIQGLLLLLHLDRQE